MKRNYELPIVEIILLDGKDVICTSIEGMTPAPDPLQPGGGSITEW